MSLPVNSRKKQVKLLMQLPPAGADHTYTALLSCEEVKENPFSLLANQLKFFLVFLVFGRCRSHQESDLNKLAQAHLSQSALMVACLIPFPKSATSWNILEFQNILEN